MKYFYTPLLLAFCASYASAHVTLETPKATAGETYKAVFRIGHGCAGSPTTALTVTIPDGVIKVKPMPKAGWTLSRTVQTITWTAKSLDAAIGDDQYDEFVLRAALPATAGALWWKTAQSCEIGSNAWTEIPAQGTSTKGLKAPAALLELTSKHEAPAAAPQAPAHHH